MSDQNEKVDIVSESHFPTSPKPVFIKVGLLVMVVISLLVYVSFQEPEDADESYDLPSDPSALIGSDPEALEREYDMEIDLEARDD